MHKTNFRGQQDQLLEDKDAAMTETQDAQQESDNIKAMLVGQTKKAGELEKQVQQLKAIIRELQAKIEQLKATEQPKETEQTKTAG